MEQLLSNQTVVLGSVFASIILLGVGIFSLMGGDRAARRFRGATGAGAAPADDVSIFHKDTRSGMLKMLEPLQRAIAQTDPHQVSAARGRLIEAGYYRPSAVEVYFTARVVGGIGCAALAGLYIYFFAPQFTGNMALFLVLCGAAFGYYYPALFVTARVDRRRANFKLGMPDALDMMLVGVEAGLSLPASLQHIVDEFEDSHPIIAEQFQIVLLEFRAGKSRGDALAGLARRMKLPETRTLSSMIEQAESLGASMAQTLRVMADELRMQRMLAAEKKASELPVLMSIPLVCCIFPSLMAVALVPSFLNSFEMFNTING